MPGGFTLHHLIVLHFFQCRHMSAGRVLCQVGSLYTILWSSISLCAHTCPQGECYAKWLHFTPSYGPPFLSVHTHVSRQSVMPGGFTLHHLMVLHFFQCTHMSAGRLLCQVGSLYTILWSSISFSAHICRQAECYARWVHFTPSYGPPFLSVHTHVHRQSVMPGGFTLHHLMVLHFFQCTHMSAGRVLCQVGSLYTILWSSISFSAHTCPQAECYARWVHFTPSYGPPFLSVHTHVRRQSVLPGGFTLHHLMVLHVFQCTRMSAGRVLCQVCQQMPSHPPPTEYMPSHNQHRYFPVHVHPTSVCSVLPTFSKGQGAI